VHRARRARARAQGLRAARAGDRLEVRSPVTEHAFAVRAWSRKNGVSVLVDEPSDGYRRLVLAAPAASG